MENINESIARAIGSKPAKPPKIPSARDCMTTGLITFQRDQLIQDVVGVLLAKQISGGPVVDERGELIGMISELDCLRALAGAAYEGHHTARDRAVCDEMSTRCVTVTPEDNVYTMTQLFETHAVRRLPVIEDGRLVGQVSRRDILRVLSGDS